MGLSECYYISIKFCKGNIIFLLYYGFRGTNSHTSAQESPDSYDKWELGLTIFYDEEIQNTAQYIIYIFNN